VTPLAIGLVLVVSVIHASWNFLSKQVAGGTAFIWVVAAMMVAGILGLTFG